MPSPPGLSPGCTRTTAGSWRTACSCRRGILGAAAELITHAADGLDERIAAVELLAQVADVHVDGAIEGRSLAIVKVLHEGVAREYAAGRAHQHFEDIEFEGGELHLLSVGDDFTGAGIERHAIHLQARRRGGAGGPRLVASQDGADARREFARVE